MEHNTAATSENKVSYCVYLPLEDPSNTDDAIKYLRDTRALLQASLATLAENHPWHCQPFHLSVSRPCSKGGRERTSEYDPGYPYLHGSTRFGDCIDDEWLIVHFLLEISKLIPEAVISVFDNDGEFLLIEAAMELPSWLDPATSQNRLFIHQNTLHLIPIPKTPAEISKFPTGTPELSTAIEIIRSPLQNTRAPERLVKTALAKARIYPERAKTLIHRAKCILPIEIAAILKEDPRLVTAAVEAFYTRDPVGTKACQRMTRFPPSTNLPSPTIVAFTQTTYAQLTAQKFHPPQPFHLPPRNEKSYKAAELGMKLACGFEILLCSLESKTEFNGQVTVETYDFNSDERWAEFNNALKKRGYYQDEMEGSRSYRQLQKLAQQSYLDDLAEESSEKGDDDDEILYPSRNILHRIRSILSKPTPPEEELVCKETEREDDEKWMEISPEDLEAMLSARAGGSGTEMQDMPEMDLDLGRLAESIEKFVGHEGGLEGAEFPGEEDMEESSDESDTDDDMDLRDDGGEATGDTWPGRGTKEDSAKEPSGQDVAFDPTKFMELMQSMLGISDTELQMIKDSREGGIEQDLEKERRKSTKVTFLEVEKETIPPLQREPAKGNEEMEEEEESDEEMETFDSLMAKMDLELSHTKIGKTYEKERMAESGETSEASVAPVNINLAVVKNMLESFKAQEGLAGPVGNLLGRMGMGLARDEGDLEEEEEGQEV